MSIYIRVDHLSSMDELSGRVDRALRGFLAVQVARWPEPAPQPVFGELNRFITSVGKRLRPAFCYYGYRGAGGADCPGIVAAAASLELLHAFALIHDDIMDGSDTRRGQPSLHRALARLHGRSGWRGHSERYGTGSAILCGDLCLAWSDELFSTCGMPTDRLADGRETLSAMRTTTIAGQYLDLREQACPGTVDSALRVVRLKAAEYTVELPLRLGAALAGARAGIHAAYSAFGAPLGEAFQLRDDLLGVFGDPDRTGKSALDDLREGKATVLMAATRARATPGQLDVLDRLVGDPELDEVAAARVRDIIVDTGAVAVVEDMIASRAAAADTALRAAPLPAEVTAVLRSLIVACTQRTT